MQFQILRQAQDDNTGKEGLWIPAFAGMTMREGLDTGLRRYDKTGSGMTRLR